MELSGWGRYPRAQAEVLSPGSLDRALEWLAAAGKGGGKSRGLIPRGLGRSYGDSALAPRVLSTAYMDQLLGFDARTGALRCSAGASLADVLQVFVPKGWFLPVTPGTKFVTLGGAIASDVHGKNHHLEGCFSDHIDSMKVATVAKGLVECSRRTRPELFRATCGGMGLTGLITEATLRLKPIKSSIVRETTHKARNLQEALALFEASQQSPYSVAWIDCLAKGKALGRSLVMLSAHAEPRRPGPGRALSAPVSPSSKQGQAETSQPETRRAPSLVLPADLPHARPVKGALVPSPAPRLSVPMDMPGALLNPWFMRGFNALYYHRALRRRSERLRHYEGSFYPLDAIANWNRLYGRRGFVQHQFVLPKAAGAEGLRAILQRIAASGRGSFLAVLKLFGAGNANHLSFPMEGYTLALDFKMAQGLLPFLNELDRMVLNYGGRVYLAKDARMSAATFKQGYPNWQKFMEVRTQYGADRLFHSLQSQRLGLA